MQNKVACPSCEFPVSPAADKTCPKCGEMVLGAIYQGLLEVDVVHSGEEWEVARTKIISAVDRGIINGHNGVKIIHGYGASSGRAQIRGQAVALLRSLAVQTKGRVVQDHGNPGAHILWLDR